MEASLHVWCPLAVQHASGTAARTLGRRQSNLPKGISRWEVFELTSAQLPARITWPIAQSSCWFTSAKLVVSVQTDLEVQCQSEGQLQIDHQGDSCLWAAQRLAQECDEVHVLWWFCTHWTSKGASFFVRKLLFYFDLKAFLLPQCKRNDSPWQGSKTCSMASIFGLGSSNSHLVDCTSIRVTPHPMCMWIGRDQVKTERRKVSVSKEVWNHRLKWLKK